EDAVAAAEIQVRSACVIPDAAAERMVFDGRSGDLHESGKRRIDELLVVRIDFVEERDLLRVQLLCHALCVPWGVWSGPFRRRAKVGLQAQRTSAARCGTMRKRSSDPNWRKMSDCCGAGVREPVFDFSRATGFSCRSHSY